MKRITLIAIAAGAIFGVVATAKLAGGQFQMRHAPQDRIVRREIA